MYCWCLPISVLTCIPISVLTCLPNSLCTVPLRVLFLCLYLSMFCLSPNLSMSGSCLPISVRTNCSCLHIPQCPASFLPIPLCSDAVSYSNLSVALYLLISLLSSILQFSNPACPSSVPYCLPHTLSPAALSSDNQRLASTLANRSNARHRSNIRTSPPIPRCMYPKCGNLWPEGAVSRIAHSPL